MSQFFEIHPDNPQLRLIKQAAQIINAGGIVALPTDSCYALVCQLDNKDAVERVRRIRGVDDKHHLTLLCRDLSEIAQYAKVDNRQYRLLKAATPGPYTFILEATKEVPRRLSHPSRKTIGLRVPENRIAHALLEELRQPLLGTTLILPDQKEPLTNADDIRERLEKQIELVIDSGACSLEPTTVIDLSNDDEPLLLRQGRGDAAAFGF
ncbi:tRNA threonylcarbamoyl adenosine modification protein (Sua5/YciO/YrdC/YwlC family) [Herbaspirillum sp. Sphag1AN]|uniref:L-threonylcarbamoyladenylate synthase n=1 Tax=unclassified Herbaspirillum TaxID=2624150 RepID=UPI00161482F1|nr:MULTISPECIES: L-threonylcarbamoyladenylate synthase [unclassified Herbaspirillum]MBB3211256.1 tRNA threonylcarbamoyl adenosine modification protein (Sua5/YciO/YrdC/YwlC family) [Herbaspirillum sp. Sphag1AN]MBB3244885.1 tRNA threonylcarbamoyl adenosine modification protein (Sua5/YciO/YrdC/YwlC family) [Herbaspirillum sp. Sphag64]